MPPTMDAFFALLLAVPLYINLWLARPWDGVGSSSAIASRGVPKAATAVRAEPRGAGR